MAHLVVQTAFVGDLVLCLPLIRQLKAWAPQEPVWLLARKGLGGLFRELGLVDEVIEYDKSDKSQWKSVARRLKKERFKWVICPHESPRTALLVAGLKADRKIGFYKWWNGFAFDQRLQRPMHLPDALRQLSLLTLLNEKFRAEFEQLARRSDIPNSESKADLIFRHSPGFPQWAKLSVLDRLNLSEERVQKVFIAPGSVWATKRWTEEGFTETARALKAQGFQVVLMGSKDEMPICERIAQSVGGCQNLCGKTTLLETVKQFATGRVLITNDSGAMHLAAMAELPSIAIFGPTVLNLGYRPWQERAAVIQQDLACRPCGLHGANECPIGTHECMKAITSNRVVEAVGKLI